MGSIHSSQKLKAQFNYLSTCNIKKSLMYINWGGQFIKNKLFITVTMNEWGGPRNLRTIQRFFSSATEMLFSFCLDKVVLVSRHWTHWELLWKGLQRHRRSYSIFEGTLRHFSVCSLQSIHTNQGTFREETNVPLPVPASSTPLTAYYTRALNFPIEHLTLLLMYM